jgi:tRNA G46 methylase TrmB
LSGKGKIECPACTGSDSYFFLKEGQLHIYRCRDCKLAFVWPMPEFSECKAKYTDDYIQDETRIQVRFEQHRKEALERIAGLVKSCCPGGRLLDIGAAGGSFLLHFASDPTWEVFGVEPSNRLLKNVCNQAVFPL